MTDLEAVALAHLGYAHRRLLGAVVRHWLGRPIPDADDLLPRHPGETLLAWARRCAAAADENIDTVPQLLAFAERALAEAARRHLRAIVLGDADYPAPVAEIPDPPPVLWLRGDVAALHAPRLVAVVGARAASPQGLEVAAGLASALAAAGVVVVSGLARGIDAAAHRAALDVGGRSVAVLGSGLDRLYPPEHRRLAEALTAHGALVSELPPGTPPIAFHFPLRNRLISGLTAATVVVEASEKSGSLITASAALEQGREVMAVPGSVASGRHRGAHALLRDGATLVESAGDVLAALGWADPAARPAEPVPPLDPALAAELGLPAGTETFTVDEVCAATGWTVGTAQATLGDLEISGRIRGIGGGRFLGSRNRVLT